MKQKPSFSPWGLIPFLMILWVPSVNAQDFLPGLEWELYVSPAEGGNRSGFSLSYPLSSWLVPGITGQFEERSTPGSMSGAAVDDSLTMVTEKTTGVDLDVVRFKALAWDAGGISGDLNLGGGAQISRLEYTQAGYFSVTGSTLNYGIRNMVSSLVIGPRILVSLNLNLSKAGRLSLVSGILPVFYYSDRQEAWIRPLVPTTGTADLSGMSTPDIHTSLEAKLWGFLNLGLGHHYRSWTREMLRVNSGGSGWEPKTSDTQVTEWTIKAGITLPLGSNNEGLRVVGGRRITLSKADGTSLPDKGEWLLELALEN